MPNPTTLQQVLDASDEQLNEWAATVVMGWEKCPNGLYTRYWWTKDGLQVRPADEYFPASDIAQAVLLLEKLYPTWQWTIERLLERGPVYCVRLTGYYPLYVQIDHADYFLSRAITQACIMARLEI